MGAGADSGGAVKRSALAALGRLPGAGLDRAGFPGADWMAGTTDPKWVQDPEFFARWLRLVPGRAVELACHPGHMDATLVGRDCHEGDGLQRRRVDEYRLLADPSFDAACRRAGFVRVMPSEWVGAAAGRWRAPPEPRRGCQRILQGYTVWNGRRRDWPKDAAVGWQRP